MSEAGRSEQVDSLRAQSSMSVRAGSAADGGSRAPTPWSADLVRPLPDIGAEELCRLDVDIDSLVGDTAPPSPEPRPPGGKGSPPPAQLIPTKLRGSPTPRSPTPRCGSALDGPLPQAYTRDDAAASLAGDSTRLSCSYRSPTPSEFTPAAAGGAS